MRTACFWLDVPSVDEGDEEKSKQWVAEQGLTFLRVKLENAEEAIADRYFESGDPDCSFWEPDRPGGEDWFGFSINDTHDGPVC